MNSLRARLLAIEEDSLTALFQGYDAVLAFEQRWDALAEDCARAQQTCDPDDEILYLIQTVASRLATLADDCVKLYVGSEALVGDMVSEMETIMSTMTIEDLSTLEVSSPHNRDHSPEDRTTHTARKRVRSGCDDELAPDDAPLPLTKRQR